jgi:hypothetical protein
MKPTALRAEESPYSKDIRTKALKEEKRSKQERKDLHPSNKLSIVDIDVGILATVGWDSA